MSKWLVFVLILGFVLRVVSLNEVPPGPSYDEIQVILNAQSLAKTGQNIPGTVTGIFGQTSGNIETGIFSELGSYILVPWVMLFGAGWPFIKLPFILVSLGMIILVFLITKKIIDEKCAQITALLFAINPWSIYIGRTAYESIFSYFFYLLAIYIFVSQKGWKILLCLPALTLGFLTYFGAKVQFPFFLILGGFLSRRQRQKSLLIMLISGFTFLILYSLIFINSPARLRVSETNSQTLTSETVDLKRRISIPSSLNKIAENKLTEQFGERAKSYLGTLSPNFLFLEGHSWGPEFLIISDHGPMYLIDFLLIILGFIALSKFYPKALFIILIGILTSMFPNAVSLSARNYIIRAGLTFPFLTILSAAGIWYLTSIALPKHFIPIVAHFANIVSQNELTSGYTRSKFICKWYKRSLLMLVSILYVLSFIIFLNQYFFRTPIDKNEGWNLQNRILSHYLKLSAQTQQDQKYTVVTNDLNGVSYIYLLFSKSYQTSSQIKKINSVMAKNIYDFGQVSFTNKCPQDLEGKLTLILDTKISCPAFEGYKSQIASPKDNGGKYAIFNDKLCGGGKKLYPQVKSIDDLNIEKMLEEEFCDKWITNPGGS